MLVLTVRAHVSGPPLDEHLYWAVLFGWYVVHRAGPLSLDHLLDKGLGFSPLPFAAHAIGAARWVDRVIAPVFQVALRLWLALALVTPLLVPEMLPASLSGMLPHPLALAAAVLLSVGLGTPAVAAGLLLAGTARAMTGDAAATTLYGHLLLALVTVFGAGRWSFDRLINGWAHVRPTLDDSVPHVVIVGAGFGGIACAAGLRHEQVRITLVDRQNHHVFQPLLYQVATGGLSPADIATPIRAMFRDDLSVRVLCGTVTGVDTASRQVIVNGRPLPYDALVLATGASHGYFGRDDWAAFAPGLKSVRDATEIRGRILSAFERAEATDDPVARSKLLTFIVCGGGPTGVELAGAIAELAHHGMAKDFRNFDPATARILLIDAGPRVLAQFSEPLSAFARRAVEALGVEVLSNSRVAAIESGAVLVNGARIEAGTVLWAAGVVASPAARWLGVEADRAGRIAVLPDMSVPGLPEVFAIGDTALSLTPDGKPVPGLAPAAKQGGSYVAAVLRTRLRGRKAPGPFRYRHMGSLATIGRQSAVADFGRIKLTGAIAWWLWGAVHILFLAGLRNRVSVVVGWVWSYLTFDVGVRLITGELAPGDADKDG
jgi:NADH dehydrogenase/putative oxidoreductase